jgi:hypothetical protein
VTPNQVSTIALAIADSRDDVLDSGVLFAANGFLTGPPHVAPPLELKDTKTSTPVHQLLGFDLRLIKFDAVARSGRQLEMRVL